MEEAELISLDLTQEPTQDINTDKVLCGAKTRRSGDNHPCRNAVVEGRTRCKFHGGATKIGIEHHRTIHGRYSKVMPSRLQENYEAAIRDPELLSLRDELALLSTRIADLLPRVETGEHEKTWTEVKTIWRQFTDARDAQNMPQMRTALTRLGGKIDAGKQDTLVWQEVGELIERRRRVVDTEQKRLVQMGQVLTYERAALLFGYITEVIKRHVTDRDTLAAISEEFRTISLNDGSRPLRP